jgi:L-alanine-DL-glutamate epimerase-like enolase superfamily enzyme
MTDLTIREVKTTLLRMPWADDPWLAGHALGSMRDLVVVEITTQSGITGMGYLHLLNLPLQRTIGACIAEAMAPRIIGRDATAVEAIWRDLWRATLTGGRGGGEQHGRTSTGGGGGAGGGDGRVPDEGGRRKRAYAGDCGGHR